MSKRIIVGLSSKGRVLFSLVQIVYYEGHSHNDDSAKSDRKQDLAPANVHLYPMQLEKSSELLLQELAVNQSIR